MVANKYAFLQITRRRFLNEWEAFKKVISRRNIRRRITIPLTLSNLKLLRRITRTENILHRNFTRRQVAIQNRVASNIGISQSTYATPFNQILKQNAKREMRLRLNATPFNQILKQNAKREMRLRLGKVTVADVLAGQPVTTNLLKFMRASIKMIGVSNLQSFIASMTQKLTLSDISDESKHYLDKAGITTACLRIKSKWTAGGK